MRRLKNIFIFVLLALAANLTAVQPLQVPSRIEPQGIKVLVEGLSIKGSDQWNLSVSTIQSKVEQTLMRFSLEPSNDEPFDKGYLYVNVSLAGPSYFVSLQYVKYLLLKEQQAHVDATVWSKGVVGFDPNYDRNTILNTLVESVEVFSTEYIKENRRKQ
jgi:hypothetical protein